MTAASAIVHVLALLALSLWSTASLAQKKLSWSGTDLNGIYCNIHHGQSSYGAFDYTNPDHFYHKLPVVEANHFTASVENLTAGKAGTVLSDLQYTLRAFPNHHRALFSLVRYQLQSKTRIQIPPECFLERALVFKPDDANVHLIYGIYLHRLGRYDMALEKYQRAEALAPDNAELYYNVGLLYLDTRRPEQARDYARKAYALNYPLPGLRDRLAQQGYPLHN